MTNGLVVVPCALRADITTSLVMLWIAIAVYLAIFVWMLVQKGRSLWNIFLAFASLIVAYIIGWFVFFPLICGSLFGFIVLFCLKNERNL